MKTRVLDLEMYHEGQEGPYVNKLCIRTKIAEFSCSLQLNIQYLKLINTIMNHLKIGSFLQTRQFSSADSFTLKSGDENFLFDFHPE